MSSSLPTPLKRASRLILGDRIYAQLAEANRRWRAQLDPRYRTGRQRMIELRDSHNGERCFIIGNGPSLSRTDLSLLRNEVTFGLNRIYLLFDRMGYSVTYFVSVNQLVIEQCAGEIAVLPCPKFISWSAHDLIDFTDDMMFLYSRPDIRFHTDISRGIWEGATVTYVAMQVAYYLGFRQVILVGVDHSFSTKGKPHTTVVSQGDDPDHFDPRYFGKGFRWQLPDLETSELAYRMAKRQFELAGGEILDATVDGMLEVFPKVDYYGLFGA